MTGGIFSNLGWIGVGALISSLISALLEPFFSELYKSMGESMANLSLPMNQSPIMYIPWILGAVGVVLVGLDLLYRRRKRNGEPVAIHTGKPDVKLIENQPTHPILHYGRLCVKKRSDNMHGGRYDRSFYYIEIINSVPSTVALNCQGSIQLDSNPYSTIWEKNRMDNIPIAHRELLYLFETSDFTGASRKETRLFLRWGRHTIDDSGINDYVNSIDKQLTILIQSDNADFPSESESFKMTIRQIIQESMEC